MSLANFGRGEFVWPALPLAISSFLQPPRGWRKEDMARMRGDQKKKSKVCLVCSLCYRSKMRSNGILIELGDPESQGVSLSTWINQICKPH